MLSDERVAERYPRVPDLNRAIPSFRREAPREADCDKEQLAMASSRTCVRPLVVCLALGVGTLGLARTAHAQPGTADTASVSVATARHDDPPRLSQDAPMMALYGSF